MVLEESTNIRGWLLKKKNSSGEWKRSFFVLQNNLLVYYQSLRDNIPKAKYELTNNSRIVDYGVSEGYRQFSLYEDNKRILWLATDDIKARYWISVMRSEIEKIQSNLEIIEVDGTSGILTSEDNPMYLHSIIQSTSIPSYMKELSSLLRSSSLKTTLTACENGCLLMDLDAGTKHPYKMVSMNLPIEVEYATYFLIDCEFTRMLWDPLFLCSNEIEKLDRNNSIYRLMYKRLSILDYPCTIQSDPRDFCLHRHFDCDADTNTYYVIFSSTTHPSCPPSAGCVRGSLQVGYRIEAVQSGVSRITMIYSLQPHGYLDNCSSFCKQFEQRFVQSLPGLRDVLSQIPEYHVLNLIERILRGMEVDSPVQSVPVSEQAMSPAVIAPYITNTVPHASECDVMNNCWEEVDGTVWSVRGKSYMITKEKVHSERNYCKLLCVDVFKSTARINHIASHPECAIHRMKDVDNLLIINLQISGNISIVSYYSIPKKEQSPTGKLMDAFMKEGHAWRDARLKLLPHIVEGNYLVKKAVGTTPCVIGTKGESSYYTGTSPLSYLECDYDMDGSTMARTLSKYLFTVSNMVIELGFVIQGVEEDELPEQVLGGFRFYHVDINSARVIFEAFHVCLTLPYSPGFSRHH